MKNLILTQLLVVLFLCCSFQQLSAGGLEGDSDALKRVNDMFDKLGGRNVWAKARSLYTIERARHPAYGSGITATFWRDLDQPGEYARLQHQKLEVTYAWSTDSGWIERNGELRDFKEDEMAERRFYWERELYTLYHQLAAGERSLTVRDLPPNGFSVLNEEGENVGNFKLTPEGDLYLWEQKGGSGPVAYIYGPHKDFGEISFPDWGTATDGNWGSYYLQVKPSTKPFSYHVNLAKPRRHWDGGAVNKGHCAAPVP